MTNVFKNFRGRTEGESGVLYVTAESRTRIGRVVQVAGDVSWHPLVVSNRNRLTRIEEFTRHWKG